MHYMDADQANGKRDWLQLHKNASGSIEKGGCCTSTYRSSRKPSKLDEQYMQDYAGEVRPSSWAMYFNGPPHMEELGNKLESIFNSFAAKQYVA